MLSGNGSPNVQLVTEPDRKKNLVESVTVKGRLRLKNQEHVLYADGKDCEKKYTVQEEHTCPICHGELVIWSDSLHGWVSCRFAMD